MPAITRLIAPLILILWILAPVHAAAASQQDGHWSKDNLASLFASVLPDYPINFHNLAEMPTNSKAGAQMKQKILDGQFSRLEPGDSIWGLSTPDLIGTIIIAGTPDTIHTINFLFPAKAIKPADLKSSLSFHAEIFAKLFPDWPQASAWPNESLHRAWTISLAQFEAENKPDPADHLIATQRGTTHLTTMGIVQQFAIFRVTTRPECDLNPLDQNVFGRWVC